ncbi:Mitochondrial import inner membrane translocase subunit TIM17-2 [Diplonema papillatum]|nr:Mitochondrial import inner membrane translocase subunit TIM17-2 [Diplonema papillatum]
MPSTLELFWEHVYQPTNVRDGGIVTSLEKGKEPCWWRVVEEAGIGYLFGVVLGTGSAVVQGARLGVPGTRFRVIRDRLVTQTNGSTLAAWTAAFAMTECSVIQLRGGTEDCINPTIAGAGAGFFTSLSGGRRAALQGAKWGALLLGTFELILNANAAYQVNWTLQESQEAPPPPDKDLPRDQRYNAKKRHDEFAWAPMDPRVAAA